MISTAVYVLIAVADSVTSWTQWWEPRVHSLFTRDGTRDELQQIFTSESVSGSAVQSRHLVECEEASVINSLPSCCIFVWPESLMLIISPASFVHLAQTKPVQVSWLLPTQAVCTKSKEKTISARVISKNMRHDNTGQINCQAEEEYIGVFLFFWTFTFWNLHSFLINLNSEASVVVVVQFLT